MTRGEFETFVRKQFESLAHESPRYAEMAALRAFGRRVFVWTNLGSAELASLYSSIRMVAMMMVESPGCDV
jgi:hypothetical protein